MRALAESVPSAASSLVGAISKDFGLPRQAEFVRNVPICLMLNNEFVSILQNFLLLGMELGYNRRVSGQLK